jgi:hypothetical protein
VGQRYANENLILPLFQVGNNLTLAVSNPANIWGMQGLKSRYPKLQMACVLITDEKFEQLYGILYGELLSARNGFSKPTPESGSADKTVIISDPGSEQRLIQKLHEDYRSFQRSAGVAPLEAEESWFSDFIAESYQAICQEYGCRKVLYRFDVTEKNTRILASPVT